MNFYSINDLSNKELVNFLKKSLKEVNDLNLIKNYHPDYENTPGNLFYVLKEGRYKNGNYFILKDQENFVACAGWNPYVYRNEKIALSLTRCYISKNYRSKWFLSKYFVPKILEETSDYKKIWITINLYNKSLYNGFELLSKGRNAGVGESWPKIFSMFVPIGIKTIYWTKQYVLEYKKDVV